LIATHINPRYNANGKIGIEAVGAEIAQHYNENIFIANDFDCYYLKRDSIIVQI